MTSIDILFWLLLALMGGVIWAIEAGLGQRHRSLLASSILASLASAVVIMFVMEDQSNLTMFAKERGEVDTGGSKKKKKTVVADVEDGKGAVEPTYGVDESKTEYSRDPFRDCPQCPELVIMSVGRTVLGSAPDEPGRKPDELKQRTVELEKPFAIGRVEITRAEFATFAKETSYRAQAQCEIPKRRGLFDWTQPGFEQDGRHAVVCVTMRDVQAYLDWLSAKGGRNYDLPSELEWEFAARAGTDTPYWLGDTANRLNANIGRSRDGTAPGGIFPANRFGISNVIGNVGELTSQCANAKPKTDVEADADAGAPVGNIRIRPEPVAAAQTCQRIVKGGSWISPPEEARHGARDILLDGKAENSIGFRVSRPVDERDNDFILTLAERRKRAKLEIEAQELAMKEQEAAEKAKLENRETLVKTEAEKKSMEAAKAKAKAELKTKREADAIAKFKADQEKAAKDAAKAKK